MRLFLGRFLATHNQAFYSRRIAELVQSTGGALRAIPELSAHVTYAFLGEVDADCLARIRDAVESAAARHSAVAFRLGPPAILFARATPRLLCAHVIRGEAGLLALAVDLATELERCAPGRVADPPRSPHVTLARFRRDAGRADARLALAALAAGASADATREDSIASIQIISSDLTKIGPVYTVVADVALRSRE